jgi:hypothetical protein
MGGQMREKLTEYSEKQRKCYFQIKERKCSYFYED